MKNGNNINGSYFDGVLIKLRRIYTKDETVSALSKKLKEVEIELGKSIAYIHELEDEKHKISLRNGGMEWYNKYLKIKEKYEKLQNIIKEDTVLYEKEKENKRLHIEIKKLKKNK